LSYVEVAAGGEHTVARRSEGSVVAWGDNTYGQCNVPALPGGLTYVEVAAGWFHTVARRSDGSVVAWGWNNYGQCNVPALPSGLSYVEVAAGYFHTVARRSDGSVVAWGSNTTSQCNVPALPSGLIHVEFAAAEWHTVARLAPAPPCGSTSSSCWPAAANSVSASGASFSVEGCPGLTANNLVFTISGLPPGKLGIFHYGAQQQHLPFGNGWACVSGSVQRVMPPLVADPNGVVVYPVDLTQFPFSGSAHSIAAGSAWNFQFWYRDPTGSPSSFNFSEAQHIVFAP
ncbi:MAG TPA: hypothetical protein VMS76_02950, partial [Planctomycetota bacterium]|nr:hypothetical protein [Planctomycetota bacterium]